MRSLRKCNKIFLRKCEGNAEFFFSQKVKNVRNFRENIFIPVSDSSNHHGPLGQGWSMLLMYSTSTCAAPTTISREFQEPPCFPASPEYHPWISRHLEVATMPHPRSNRRGQDGCPSSAHLQPSYPPTPPVPSLPPPIPTQDQWGSRPVDPPDKEGGEDQEGEG